MVLGGYKLCTFTMGVNIVPDNLCHFDIFTATFNMSHHLRHNCYFNFPAVFTSQFFFAREF